MTKNVYGITFKDIKPHLDSKIEEIGLKSIEIVYECPDTDLAMRVANYVRKHDLLATVNGLNVTIGN